MDDRAVSVSAPPPAPASARGAPFGPELWGLGNLGSQIMWAVFFLGPIAVVITAMILTPNNHGHGTHTQLGLPPCGFLVATGYPCPGCGLTTAFSYMARLDFIGAFSANPFGILLFLTTVAMVPVAAVGFWRRTPVIETLDRLHAEKIAIGLSVISVSVWVVKLSTQAFG